MTIATMRTADTDHFMIIITPDNDISMSRITLLMAIENPFTDLNTKLPNYIESDLQAMLQGRTIN